MRATEVSRQTASDAMAWVGGKLKDCPKGMSYCANDCWISVSPKGVYREDTGTKTLLRIPVPPSNTTSSGAISMSADCTRAAFEVPDPKGIGWETWDVTSGKKLRASHFNVAGGAVAAGLVASGNFLQWSHSRGLDRYEEIKSGVIGPDIGLATTMSPDERFMLIGGGMTFATNQDMPAELRNPKNGKLVYALPKVKERSVVGGFCPSGNLVWTRSTDAGITIRATSDSAPLLELPGATSAVFSTDGSQLAVIDTKSKTARIVRLERCTGTDCAPLADCTPVKP